MQTGTWELILNEFKATVPQKGTVCDCMIQVQSHSEMAGEMPIRNLKIDKDEIKTNDAQERKRLAEKYMVKHEDKDRVTITTVFPPGTALPQKFSDITDKDGNPVFGDNGITVAKKIKVGDKEYTEAELAELVAKKETKKEESKK